MGKQVRKDELIKAIGYKFKELRMAKGESQFEVHVATGVNVKRIEAGTQNILRA